MTQWLPTLITLALAAGPLAAQEPMYGLGMVVAGPVGALNSTTYASGAAESYNSGLGAQFTVSWPLDRSLAVRLNLGGTTYNGTATQGASNWNLYDATVSFGAEAEYFLGAGNANRHLGTYLIAGLALDFERFSTSSWDPYTVSSAIDKNRLGANAGLGHTFRSYRRWCWTLEAVYHQTLTDTATNAGAGAFPAGKYTRLVPGTPASDGFKLVLGMAF